MTKARGFMLQASYRVVSGPNGHPNLGLDFERVIGDSRQIDLYSRFVR